MGYSENMSPDSASSLFPDRPIRPLPKRRLRERLSPDVADAIKYPPAPQNIPPLFAYPYNSKEELGLLRSEPSAVVNRENVAELGQETGLRRNGLSGEHHDESLIGQARRALVSRPFQDTQGAFRTPQRPTPARHNAVQPPPSTTSSADGYDSFENTNNKKKRKIPTAGETILNGTHVLNDSSALGMPSPPTTGDEGPGDVTGAVPSPYYQSGGVSASTQGISGPGRGRYGRVRSGRSPLRTLPDPNGAWNGRTPKLRGPGQYPSPPRGENLGIISNAIATAEKLPVPQGQENISLLQQQQPSPKTSPTTSTQFTFTFDSQNPVSWPGSDPAPSHNSAHIHPTAATYRNSHQAMGSQASTTGGGPVAPARASLSQAGTHAATEMGGGKEAATANAAPKKPKRRGNSLARAARARRQQTEYNNYLHPPTSEEFWLCEFCEYERIFGHPPVALIRQYELKDRRRREEDANRKRLLDKAKSKSRKGKKANKSAAKNNAANSNRTPAPPPPPPEEEDPHQAYYDRDNEYYQDDVDPRPEYYVDNVSGSAHAYDTTGEWIPPQRPVSRPTA